MLASASPEHYATCLHYLLADPEVHSILVILPPPPVYSAGGVARAMIPLINTSQKPVVVALMGERMIQEAVEYFRAGRVPEYRFPERAARALAILTQRSEFLNREPATAIHFDDIRPSLVQQALAQNTVGGTGFLPQEVCNQIMAAYGIPIPRIELAREPDQAAEFAKQLDYPVALKLASPDIPHKSDVGGILLNLHDAAAVTKGFSQIVQNARAARPDANVLGVHVQQMISQGQEVIVGVVQDPQFGPLVMFGSGGVEVEGLKDVEFALAPLSRPEGEYLLENTWAGQKLRGYRHVPPADREAVLEALTRVAQLSVDFPQLSEIEINPLRVLPDGKGVYAVDVRIKIA
jgi:acetyltransferase